MSDPAGGEGAAHNATVAVDPGGELEAAEREQRKLVAAVDYHAREVEAAQVAVDHANIRVGRRETRLEEARTQVARASERLAAAQARHAAAVQAADTSAN